MKKSGKFITALLLSSALICAAIPSQSLQAQTVTITKEAISDDLYCVTELVETSGSGIQPFSATQTKSGSKTQRYVNSSGTTLWYVTVHASFTYNGSTSSCTSADVTAESNSSSWKVTNKSSWKSGNTGYASATGHQYNILGMETNTLSRTVSISCTKNGTLQKKENRDAS